MIKTIFTNPKLYQSAFWLAIISLFFIYSGAYLLVDFNNEVAKGFLLLFLPLPIVFISSLIIPLFTYKDQTQTSVQWYYKAIALFLINSVVLLCFDALYYYLIDTSIIESLKDGVEALNSDVQGEEDSEEVIDDLPYLWQLKDLILGILVITTFITNWIIQRRNTKLLTIE